MTAHRERAGPSAASRALRAGLVAALAGCSDPAGDVPRAHDAAPFDLAPAPDEAVEAAVPDASHDAREAAVVDADDAPADLAKTSVDDASVDAPDAAVDDADDVVDAPTDPSDAADAGGAADVRDVAVVDASSCAVAGDLGSAVGARVVVGSTAGAPRGAEGSCGGRDAPELTYAWTAPAAGTYTFHTRGSSYDTLVYLRDGDCAGRELACNDDIILGVAQASEVSATLAAGQRVAVVVDGFGAGSGGFALGIAEGPPVRCASGARRPCYGGPEGTRGVGRCRDGTQVCHATGVWPEACVGDPHPVPEVCANGFDDDCDGASDEGCTTGPTRAFAGTLRYQYREVNAALTDWGPSQEGPARGFAVYAMRGGERVDGAVTGADGRFAIRFRDPPAADDALVVAALADDGADVLAYAVADPGGAAGTREPFAAAPPAPRVWSWSWRADALPADGALRIDEAAGSGAARVFEGVRRSVAYARDAYGGRAGMALAVWFRQGVAWSCGGCFGEAPVDAFGQAFAAQLAYPGGDDALWWADTVVAHELGHWTMASYGTPPREGGTHALNTPLAPGLAWSEGYATWLGSASRGAPLFVSRQGGVTYWVDIAARRLSNGAPWRGADPAAGLLQPMAENEVSAMLWALAPADARAPLHAALASPRMNVGPYARGCLNTAGANVPVLPDMLDALACAGLPRAAIDAATHGAYPYDSATPRCASAPASAPASNTGAFVQGAWRVLAGPWTSRDGATRVRLAARVEQRGVVPDVVRVSVRVPAGAQLAAGPQAWAVPVSGPGTANETAIEVAYRGVPRDDLVMVLDTRDAAMGAHGEIPWRFGRGEPAVVAPVAAGPRLVLRGRDLGPSVAMGQR